MCGKESAAYDVANSCRADEVSNLQPPAAREGRSKREAVSALSRRIILALFEKRVWEDQGTYRRKTIVVRRPREGERDGPTHMQAGTGPVGQKDQPGFVWTSDRQRDRDELRALNV